MHMPFHSVIHRCLPAVCRSDPGWQVPLYIDGVGFPSLFPPTLMAPHIYPSTLPDLTFPEISLFDYILPEHDKWGADKPAYIDGLTNEVLTRRALRHNALTLGATLVDKLGFKEGGVVMLLSPNSIHYPVVEFATVRVFSSSS